MKSKFLISFVAIIGLVGFTGCKPKQTALTGQVFIVTKGAENIKLGLVEVQLISKQQVLDSLKLKSAAVQAEISSRQKQYEAAQGEVQKASTNLTLFKTDGPLTKPEYTSLKAEYQSLVETNSQLTNSMSLLDAKLYQLGDAADIAKDIQAQSSSSDKQKAEAAKTIAAFEAFDSGDYTNRWKMLNEWRENNFRMFSIKIKTDTVEARADSEMADLEKQLAQVQSRSDAAKAQLDDYPKVETYLAGFVTPAIQKSLTDADGKFAFVYPPDKEFVLFAHAQRMVLNKTETYYWLVNAPGNVETAQIFLSNNNLASADPDDYFTIKPK